MRSEILNEVIFSKKNKIPIAIVTRINDGVQSIIDNEKVSGVLTFNQDELEKIRTFIKDDKSCLFQNGQLFVHVFNPPLRLIIIGAVHIAQSLAPMATPAGYEVTIVDPRGFFATKDRFPSVSLSNEWPDEALKKLNIDARTAVVTLTHDPKLDDPALQVVLTSNAFYIASLGGRNTHKGRLSRLKNFGFTDDALGRIHGPAGLPIGAVTPSEIALAILAQLTAVRRGRSTVLEMTKSK